MCRSLLATCDLLILCHAHSHEIDVWSLLLLWIWHVSLDTTWFFIFYFFLMAAATPAKCQSCSQIKQLKVCFRSLKSASIDLHIPSLLDTLNRRYWCKQQLQRPIKQSALPTGTVRPVSLTIEQIWSWLEPCSIDMAHFLFVSLLPTLSQPNDLQ